MIENTSIYRTLQQLQKEKIIELDHSHKGYQPHVHHGYFHNENDGKEGGKPPNKKEND